MSAFPLKADIRQSAIIGGYGFATFKGLKALCIAYCQFVAGGKPDGVIPEAAYLEALKSIFLR